MSPLLNSICRVIDICRHCRLGSGVYADVFAIENKAYKLYKSGPEIPPRQTKEGRKRVYACQLEALKLSCQNVWLKDHVAKLYGACTIDDVLDQTGASVRDAYLLDCCQILELIDPNEIACKVTTEGLRDNNEHLRKAMRRFDGLGIAAKDSSVFWPDDPARFKFIDIEMRDCLFQGRSI